MASNNGDRKDQILAEAQRRKDAAQAEQTEAHATDLVIFTINQDLYAFESKDVKELIPFKTIAFVPGCPDIIKGIVNVRGDIESVINLHKILGAAPSEPTREARIVIAAKNGVRSGILVDAVVDVINVPADKLKRPISTLDKTVKEYAVAGETLYQNRYVALLDVGKIFDRLTSGM